MAVFRDLLLFVVSITICLGRHHVRHHHGHHHHSRSHDHILFNVNDNDPMTLFQIPTNNSYLESTPKVLFEVGEKKADVPTGSDTELEKINKQLKDALSKMNKPTTSITSINFNDPLDMKNIAAIQGGFDKAFPGLQSLVEGIKKKDGFKIATSALTIASSVALAVGGPVGMIVATVLNLAKTIVEIIQPVEEQESQQDQLKRVVSEALREYRQYALVASFKGFTKKSEMLQSNLKSVDDFLGRSLKDLLKTEGDISDFINKDSVRSEALSVSKRLRHSKLQNIFVNVIIPRAHDVMYDGVTTLGKIEYEISSVCDHVNSKDADAVREDAAKRCLKMLELYSEMSFQRRFTYISQLTNTLEKVINNKDTNEATKMKALMQLRLIADNMLITQEQDIKVLDFMVKPVYNYRRRYIINYFYSYRYKYHHFNTYLTSLEMDVNFGLFLCTDVSLLGNCKEYSLDDLKQKSNVEIKFTEKTMVPKSLMIPRDFKAIVGYKETDIQPITIYGPSTIASLLYDKLSVEKITVYNMSVEEKKSSLGVSICRLTSATNKPHESLCNVTLVDDYVEYEFKGTGKSKDSYKSFDIPDNVVVFGLETIEKKIILRGPYFGPRVIETAAASAYWTSLHVLDSSNSAMVESYNSKLKSFCGTSTTSLGFCSLKTFISRPLLEICKKENMQGYCDFIPIQVENNRQVVDLDYINVYALQEKEEVKEKKKKKGKEEKEEAEKSWLEQDLSELEKDSKIKSFKVGVDDSIWKPSIDGKLPVNALKSMRIPQGYTVELMTEPKGKGISYGIYRGPVQISTIDGNKDEASLIKSMIITKA